jgi:glycosyltransferase involved in cell wall biosynthesis
MTPPVKLLHFVHTDEAGPFKVGSFHLKREFANLGMDCIQVYPWRLFVKKWRSPRQEPRAWAAIPTASYKIKPLSWAFIWINSIIYFCVSYLTTWRHWRPAVVMVDSLYFLPLAAIFHRLLGTRLIVRFTDFLWELDETLDREKARDITLQFCREADEVIATNSMLAQWLSQRLGKPVTCIANGVDFDHFCSRADRSASLRNKVIYYGALDGRLDFDLIRKISERQELRLSVAGNDTELLTLAESGEFLGPLKYGDLPGVLRDFQIGILPFTTSLANEGRFPMKFYEYAAAGLLIVSYPFEGILAEVAGMKGVFFAEDFTHESFLRALSAALECAATAGEFAEKSNHNVEIAQANSWGERAQRYAGLIGPICI